MEIEENERKGNDGVGKRMGKLGEQGGKCKRRREGTFRKFLGCYELPKQFHAESQNISFPPAFSISKVICLSFLPWLAVSKLSCYRISKPREILSTKTYKYMLRVSRAVLVCWIPIVDWLYIKDGFPKRTRSVCKESRMWSDKHDGFLTGIGKISVVSRLSVCCGLPNLQSLLNRIPLRFVT